MICSNCGKDKVKERYKQKKNLKWLFCDESKRMWDGSTCPDCVFGFVAEKPNKTPRKCLRCGGLLQINRYYHPHCLTAISEKYDYYDYGYHYGG